MQNQGVQPCAWSRSVEGVLDLANWRKLGVTAWLAVIVALALLHALHLGADFPNHSPWYSDWAKYTDEGWYGNAAVRAHLFGNWYLKDDFNPAVALPVWPALEWVVFGFTGVTVEAARGLAVSFFWINLVLTFLLVRSRWPRWAGLLAVTLLAASPFLYSFSRLAILEPALNALTLAGLNLAVRMDRWRRPLLAAATIGLIFTLMMLTKTTAVFLAPALAWAMASAMKRGKVALRMALRCGAIAILVAVGLYGAWLACVAHAGLMTDYRYLFLVNNYAKPKEKIWPLMSLYWSFHGALWVDRILLPLAGVAVIGAAISRKSAWAHELLRDPAFGASFWGMVGYIFFMTYQNHPQPRYFAVVAFFAFIVIATGAGAAARAPEVRRFGFAVVAIAAMAAALNAGQTLNYVMHPEYTYVNAAAALTQYIDAHPNGRRLLLSISGDDLTLMTHLPSICDDFGTVDLPVRTEEYQPGWYASWNDLDPGTLQDLHIHYSLEQVAKFPALDDPERNVLVLFKLHRLPGGQVRPYSDALMQVLPDDKIDVLIE